jgi:hypothetical protein
MSPFWSTKSRPDKSRAAYLWGLRCLVVCGSMDLLFEFFQRIHPEGLLEKHLQGFVGFNGINPSYKVSADCPELFAYGFQEHFSGLFEFAALLPALLIFFSLPIKVMLKLFPYLL